MDRSKFVIGGITAALFAVVVTTSPTLWYFNLQEAMIRQDTLLVLLSGVMFIASILMAFSLLLLLFLYSGSKVDS